MGPCDRAAYYSVPSDKGEMQCQDSVAKVCAVPIELASGDVNGMQSVRSNDYRSNDLG